MRTRGARGARRRRSLSFRLARRRHADRPPPAILLDRPVLLLHLQPPRRAPALVRAGLVLGDQALVAALDHLRPGVQTVRCKPPHRVNEARARDDIFEARPALAQWPLADIAALHVQHVAKRRGRALTAPPPWFTPPGGPERRPRPGAPPSGRPTSCPPACRAPR